MLNAKEKIKDSGIGVMTKNEKIMEIYKLYKKRYTHMEKL